MRIGELAAELGLNPKTIRYYEEIGLLPEPRRTPAGYRLYEAADRERLAFILKAREVGLSLDEISEIMAVRRGGQPPCEHVLGLLDCKIAGIDQQLRALEDVRQELVSLREEAVPAGALMARSAGSSNTTHSTGRSRRSPRRRARSGRWAPTAEAGCAEPRPAHVDSSA